MYTTKQIVAQIPPSEQEEVLEKIKALNLDSIFDSVNLKEIGKDAGIKLIGTLREKVLPIFRDNFGVAVSLALSVALDELENRIKAL